MKDYITNRYGKPLPYPERRGIDLTGEGGYAFLENMYIDYDGSGGAVESIVGYRRIRRFKERISSFCQLTENGKSTLIIHSGSGLYIASAEERDSGLPLTKIGDAESGASRMTVLCGKCLFTDGKRLSLIDADGGVDIISEETELAECTTSVIYDQRLFLSGNPALPDIIFYSEPMLDDKIRFDGGRINEDATGGILSLFTLDETLIALGKSKMLIHKREKNYGEYPLMRTVSGIHPTSVGFLSGRKLIFMTDEGLVAAEPDVDGQQIRIKCLSRKIAELMLKESAKPIKTALWMGYLTISVDDRLYLADLRNGDEPEWYLIVGVGGYKNDRRVFKYKKETGDGLDLAPIPDRVANGEIYSRGAEDGSLSYYSAEENMRYAVYPTDQLCGGDFSHPSQLVSDGKLLWFSADDGLYLFNNDKRGKIPDEKECHGDEKMKIAEDRIHPFYYSFAGHSPGYTLITHSCDGITDRKDRQTSTRLEIRIKRLSNGTVRAVDLKDGRVMGERIIRSANRRKGREKDEKTPLRTDDFITFDMPARIFKNGKTQLCLVSDGSAPFGIESISYKKHI